MLSRADAVRVHRQLRKAERYAPADRVRRRRPGSGGGESKRYAKITRGLRRADPTATPAIEALTLYKIKLLTETVYPAWSATHGEYAKDYLVQYEGLDYKSKVKHISADGKKPTNTSYWTLVSTDGYILGYHYSSDLTQTSPWLQVGDIVEVVRLADYDAENSPIAGTEKWYIHATVSKVEEVEDEKLLTSQQWNDTGKRATSVYK